MQRERESEREMEMTEGVTVAEPTSVLKKSPFCHRASPGAVADRWEHRALTSSTCTRVPPVVAALGKKLRARIDETRRLPK